MVAKSHDVRPYRRNIIKSFLEKLGTHDISQITKVLKGIFDGIGTGEWGKKDLSEIIADEKVDEVVVTTLEQIKNRNDFPKSFLIVLEFLLEIYKLSSRIKIHIKILSNIWRLIQGVPEQQREFYIWANEIMKCDQSFECEDSNELEVFYRELFPLEEIPNMKGPQMEVAKNLFVEINKKAKYISVSSTFKDREVEKEYKRRVEMKCLKLIEVLTSMVYEIKEEGVNNQILNFYIQLYTSKDNSQQDINEFLFKLLQDFKQQFQAKNTAMLVQTIKLMSVVINDSEKNVETNIKSLISKKEPDYAKFIVINEVSYISSESSKKLDVIFAMNTPVIRLRKFFAKEFNLTWQEVKIVSHKLIEDYENSLTLSEIKLNPNQPLTISRRSTQSQTEEELIINDEMNPKVARCFQVIFERYSTNGKMDKSQASSFTALCLGSSCSVKYYNEKIANLYNNFDDDNDGYLTLENFYKFYTEAIKDRPATVWSNLRSFGVLGNLRFKDEPEEDEEITRYPRSIIAEEEKVYEILFDLLHEKEVASVAFELLERLPVSKLIEEQLLNVESVEDLSSILKTPDLYELFYKLNIIEYLAHSHDFETNREKEWHEKFISLTGYELLYSSLLEVINRAQPENIETEEIIQQIFQTSLNLLNEYWIECFSEREDSLRLSLSFISYDAEIDDKMDYLVFERFFNSDAKITPKNSKIPWSEKSQWKGENLETITDFLLREFTNKWIEAPIVNSSTQRKEKIYGLTKLLVKLIDSLDILFLNKNPQKFIDKISTLLDRIPSSHLIKQFYCLILSQCFHTHENKYQGIFIRELFKNLTKGSITSEHFRVLSTLVFRFGIGNTNDEEESEETTQKLKEVLFENVFNHTNELTVEGCAKLLTKFELGGTSFEVVEKIWDNRIFNPTTICEKEQSKVAIYELILKICNDNPEIANKIIRKVLSTLEKEIKTLKIVYCNEFKQRSNTGFAGLKNLGSTCYINSMIQQLFMNKNFRYCVLRADDGLEPSIISVIGNKDEVREVDDNFLHQVQRIFSYLEGTNRIDYVAKDFCVAYKPFGESVNVLIQQDVQEFVSMFFDRLEAGLSKTVFKKLVEDFYSGKTANLFKCHACQKTKKVEENFHSISLEVKTSKTLAESLNRFCLEEMINDYKCDFCEKKVDVTKVTRISKAPKTLIIHLQRIVFNYDTFINEKITTKHSFPQNFNIYESTLQNYERTETGNSEGMEIPKEYEYNLIGIICHIGTAESGHYISYIKSSENKWLEFNDSQVSTFNPSNIESECFGGNYASSAFDDDYFEEKRESSKSAYLLLYEKCGENTISLILDHHLQGCKTDKEIEAFKLSTLKTLDLKEVLTKLNKDEINHSQQKVSENENTQNATVNMESHEESSSAPEDSEKETKDLLDQKEIEIRRHLSEDNIETDIQPSEEKLTFDPTKEEAKNIVVFVEDPVSPYLCEKIQTEIEDDNHIHFFEKCLSSASFAKFFAQLISKPNDLYGEVLTICQKLTFGFWLKSPSFKDLLSMLDGILKVYPAGFESVITNNPNIESLLIESSDSDIRTVMANFLAKVISDTVEEKQINIKDQPEDPIFQFLDKLLALLPTTVSKCWTKFGQYFEFWYELSNKGTSLVEYMVDREIVKHFMDYFLDNKSPLKIYATKRQHSIGSSYANPNFSMLLKCVFSLLQQRFNLHENTQGNQKSFSISPDEELLLMSFESLEKLISDNYESIAAQLVKEICPNNLSASEKAAVVLLRGISKSSTDTIQPYLEVVHEFILIDDEYQDLRIKWIIGQQTLTISNQKTLTAISSFSLDERIHNFNSSLDFENGSSLLEPTYVYHKRIETFSLLMVRELLRLCDCSQKIRKYIFTLSSPTYLTSGYADFMKGFIDRYYEEQRRSYNLYSSSSGFNKEELAKEVKQLYERIANIVETEQGSFSEAEQKESILISNHEEKDKMESEKEEYLEENVLEGENMGEIRGASLFSSKKGEIFSEFLPFNRENPYEKLSKGTEDNFNETDEEDKDDENLEENYSINLETNFTNSGRINSNDSDQDWLHPSDENYRPQVNGVRRGNRDTMTYGEEYFEESADVHGQQFEGEEMKRWNSYEHMMRVENKADKHLIDEQWEEHENLIQSNKNDEKCAKTNKIKEIWHPIKFEYTPISTVPVPETISGLTIEEHRSPVTYILTKPTGISNQTFKTMSGVQRMSDRIEPDALKNSKVQYVHGFFVRNTSREYIRIQTNDGSQYCKSTDVLFIWADKIEKIWISERSIDWPKQQLFPRKTSENCEE